MVGARIKPGMLWALALLSPVSAFAEVGPLITQGDHWSQFSHIWIFAVPLCNRDEI